MLDRYRKKIEVMLEPLAQKIPLSANAMSYMSLIFAFFSGIASFFSKNLVALLPIAAFMLSLNGICDALDGKIARIRGQIGKQGDFIDHVIDRFSDVFILGGIILSPWVNKLLGIPAIVTVLLVSYLGTQAQAVGQGRLYVGMLARADRIAILFCALILQTLVIDKVFNLYILEWVMVYFIAAGIVTIIQRYYTILQRFKMR